MSLAKLTQWTGPTTSFRPSGKYGEADATALKGRSRAAVWADSESDYDRAMRSGDDLDGYGCCTVSSEEEQHRPTEGLNVYKMGASWRGSDGVLRATNHRFNSEAAYARAEIVLLTSSLWREAGMLSFMATSKHDIRPHLLLLFHAQDLQALPTILSYACNYLQASGNAASVTLSLRVMQSAARDALDYLWQRRAGLDVNARAKQLGVRSKTYRDLRGQAVRMYARRLSEAESLFQAACG